MPKKPNHLLRVRFYCNLDDPRPINWPVKFPYWVTGESETHSIVVSYADSENYIKRNWPEAIDLDSQEVPAITFSDRFPKPDWYAG